MGVDISDIRYVMHYGSPRDITEYIQGIGRAGRDQVYAQAMLYFSKQQMSKASPEMKMYAQKTDTCLRHTLYEKFERNEVKKPSVKHECCCYCNLSYACGQNESCSHTIPEYEKADYGEKPISIVRHVTPEDKELFQEVLVEYRSKLTQEHMNCTTFTSREMLIRLSMDVIKDVAEHVSHINNMLYIMENTNVCKRKHAAEIIMILQDIFGDVADAELVNAKIAISKKEMDENQMSLAELHAEDFVDEEDGFEMEDDAYFDDLQAIIFSDSDELST
eukprot:gene17866-19647_t